jgi:hypothetical protein
MLAAAMLPSLRATEIPINSVPTEYTLTHYAFQVDPETQRARILLRYTWPDTVMGGDTGPGLNSVPVQVEDLTFDAAHGQVIYDARGTQTVCATVKSRRFLFWEWASITPTGQCVVVSRRLRHDLDRGGDRKHPEMTDSFLEIR